MTRKERRRPVRRWLRIAGGPIVVGAAALAWPDAPDRLFHPARFAAGGAGRAAGAPSAYLDAARPRLAAGLSIAHLLLPGGDAPVVVTALGAETGARVYLDPATAQVLEVVAIDRPDEPAPLARPAQAVAAIMARARTATPGRVREVRWPTHRTPDWTVTLAGGAVVKVADDTRIAGAAVARQRGVRLPAIARIAPAWWAAIVLAAVVPALWPRGGKRRRGVRR